MDIQVQDQIDEMLAESKGSFLNKYKLESTHGYAVHFISGISGALFYASKVNKMTGCVQFLYATFATEQNATVQNK